MIKYFCHMLNKIYCYIVNKNMNTELNESSPLAAVARFHDWRSVKFEMAYLPASDDYLQWSLGPNFKAAPFDVPYSYPNENGVDGRIFGTNNIPIRNTMFCFPYVDSCAKSFQTRAPGQANM